MARVVNPARSLPYIGLADVVLVENPLLVGEHLQIGSGVVGQGGFVERTVVYVAQNLVGA